MLFVERWQTRWW